MLNKKIFKKGLEELQNCFDGFELTEDRIKVWYKYCQDLTDEKFLYKIKNCIKGCRRTPTLADILDLRDYYVNEKEEAMIEARKREKEWQKLKEEDKKDAGKYALMPKEFVNKIKQNLKKIEEKGKVFNR